jgi:hypothetical protein
VKSSIDHLLLHYEVARELWASIFRLFGVEWVMPRRVIELLACWRGQLGSRNILEAWRMTSLCLMWCIWRERNARCFEDREISMEELNNVMFKSLYTWIAAYNSPHFSSFSEFLDFCSFFLLDRGFLLYTSCILGLRPFELLMRLIYLLKKIACLGVLWIIMHE